MYSGPGSGPMLAAAAAWDGLATELHSTATAYGSVLAELTAGTWLGAASAAMTAATAPYVAWMRSTAAQAEQTATQAKAASAAFEVTFAAMVPPAVIEANRTLLQALVATNLFGQNSPAIAATETLYAEMWAQDATAMYGYAGTSASATTLTPFTPAPPTTNGTSQPATAQLASTALQGLTSTATGTAQTTVLDTLGTLSNLEGNTLFLPSVAQAGLTPLSTTGIFADLQYDDTEQMLQNSQSELLKTLVRTTQDTFHLNGWKLPDYLDDAGVATRSASAVVGQARAVGALSVPQAWTVTAPEIRLAALASPATGLSAVPEGMAACSPGSLFSEMALANMASSAITGRAIPGRQERVASVACARHVSTTANSPTPHRAAIAVDISEFADALVKLGDLRDSGLLTEEEFSKEKERLLAR
jgi:PPE-repeat protein